MAKKGLINIVLFIMLLAAAFLVQDIIRFKRLPARTTRILKFPVELDRYASKDVSLDEKTYEILNTRTIFFRQYSRGEEMPIWFLVVYGEEDRQSFHPPEYCYLGSGDVELVSKKVEKVDLDMGGLEANRLLFKMDRHRQLVYYWYTAGEKMTASYYKQQMFFMMAQLKRKKIGGTLIRISTIVPETESEEDGERRIADFLNLALPKIKEMQ